MLGIGTFQPGARSSPTQLRHRTLTHAKDDELGKLYRAPLSEFVFLRNALATERRELATS
jgi:hypothetical protein